MQNNHTIRRLCGLVLAIAPWLFMSAPIFLGAWLLFPMSQTFSNNEEKDSTTKE